MSKSDMGWNKSAIGDFICKFFYSEQSSIKKCPVGISRVYV